MDHSVAGHRIKTCPFEALSEKERKEDLHWTEQCYFTLSVLLTVETRLFSCFFVIVFGVLGSIDRGM